VKPRIVVVGSSNTDIVVRVPRLPARGETVLGSQSIMAAGGKGANQAVAAARLGAQVTLVAKLGRDMFGRAALQGYEAEGINVEYIGWDDEAASGVALIMVDETGENAIAVASGANGRLAPADVAPAESAIAEADVLLLQMEIPLESVRLAAQMARRHGVGVILNPAPAGPLPDDLLSLVDILTPNETEAATLTGVPLASPDQANEVAGLLLSRGPAAVVITLGAQGALVAKGDQMTQVPSFAVTPVDTTAAGDAFNGALAVAWAQGTDLTEAVRYANAAGALSVTKLGAQPSLPTAEEVQQFLSVARPSRSRETR
jgi:ribokinase